MAKKSFTSAIEGRNDSPTAQLIQIYEGGEDAKLQPIKEAKAAGSKNTTARPLANVAPAKASGEENKTKRVELLMKPSVYNAIKEKAAADGRSFNDYVNRLLEATIEGK